MSSRALILDFGGVITRTLFETHQATEQALGLKPGTLTWRGPFDTATDPLWVSMQNGEISERDYWLTRAREAGRLLGEEWTSMETLVRRARGSDPQAAIRPEAQRAILHAKRRGVKLAILSNELDLFYGVEFRKRLPLMYLFDVIVDATYTHILKPSAEAYLLCIAQLGVAPADCVFVDDQPRNLDGAAAVGLPAIRFDVANPAESFGAALDALASPS